MQPAYFHHRESFVPKVCCFTATLHTGYFSNNITLLKNGQLAPNLLELISIFKVALHGMIIGDLGDLLLFFCSEFIRQT